MIRFKRPKYHKKLSYGRTMPVLWHILHPALEGHEKTARTLKALCGYEWDNIMMDATFSKAIKTKPAGEHCTKCEAKL